MPFERVPIDTDDLTCRYLAGDSCETIAKALGVGRKLVYNRIKEMGIIRNNRVDLPGDDIVARYLAGESEKALGKAYGVSRSAIRRYLLTADTPIRGRSDAMFTRMANTSPDERAKLAAAAHDAVRGRTVSFDEQCRRALGVEAVGMNSGNVSETERHLAGMLFDRGIETIPQKAVGPYNVDIAAGTVAVEVLGGHWHRAKRHGERLRYLLDHGWDVIYIWVDVRYPLGPGAAEYVVAHVEERDRNQPVGVAIGWFGVADSSWPDATRIVTRSPT